MLLSLIILGILGGLITGISPCILPILPVILVTGGADSARTASTEFGQTGIAKDSADNMQALFSRRSAVIGNAAPAPMQRTASRWRPYQVVGGLVLSFSLFTLLGSVILAALHLPQDTLRILGITFLIIVGLSMLIPPLERLLEKPFANSQNSERNAAPHVAASSWGLLSVSSMCPVRVRFLQLLPLLAQLETSVSKP